MTHEQRHKAAVKVEVICAASVVASKQPLIARYGRKLALRVCPVCHGSRNISVVPASRQSLTATDGPLFGARPVQAGENASLAALLEWRRAGVPLSHVSLSSDAFGSLPEVPHPHAAAAMSPRTARTHLLAFLQCCTTLCQPSCHLETACSSGW